MIDKTGFSIGTMVDPHSSFKPLPDWVAFDLCKAYPVANGNFLLHNTRNNKRAIIMPEVYTSLLHSVQFKTVAMHASKIIEGNPDMVSEKDSIHHVFKQMLDIGMMVSGKEVCNRLKSSVETSTQKQELSTPVVAIITWERPQALERLLESIVVNCESGGIHRLYVIDDSRNAENIARNKEIVEAFVTRIDTSLQYFGQEEQQSLLGHLVEKLPQHENSIRFLADQARWRDHWTAGLNRNLALLLSCGHRLVMIDDDTICDVYEPPQPRPNITFSDDPREADFFDQDKDWDYLHQPINPDPINRHMQCLGLSLSEAIAVLGENHLKAAGLGNATALQISELRPDSKVLMTECGSLGCPGTNKNTWLPDMAPKSLRRMLSSAERTTNALTRRKVWSGRNHPHFAPRPNMSQITGFDNREMLPPYLPVFRAQDRLFGNMLDFIFPSSVTLDYPWAIPHLPMPEREWRDRDLSFTPANSFPGFFFEKVIEQKSYCMSDSPLDRLANLSAWFKDMASTPNQTLNAMYQDTRLCDSSERLEHLGKLLASADSAPVNWKNYLRNGITQLNADLDKSSRADFPLKGFPANLKGDELMTFWKDVWAGFSAALTAWPEIRSASVEFIQADSSAQ